MTVDNHLLPFWTSVLRLSPQLYMDRLEPFKPDRVGVTVFEETAPSPSFDRVIQVDHSKYKYVIEYAIYWDYDIQHIYDLEHVWIYVNHEDEVGYSEASFHGGYRVALLRDHSNLTDDKRIKVFVQPGKHAMSPLEELFRLLPNVESCCLADAGVDGVLEPSMLTGEFKFGDNIDMLAEKHLRTFSFQPSFDYIPYTWSPDLFVSWEELKREIPIRMKTLLSTLT